MSTPFDPYSNWFKIPPHEQPANHYRLLGLEPFEKSREKIEDAVAVRAEFLTTMSMGDYVADAQKLLNEVARARICLVNPAKRKAYDDALRNQLNEQALKGNASQPIAMAIPINIDMDDSAALQDLKMALAARAPTAKQAQELGASPQIKSKALPEIPGKRLPSEQRDGWKIGLWAGAIAIAICIIGGVLFFLLGSKDSDSTVSQNKATEAVSPSAPVKEQPLENFSRPTSERESSPETADSPKPATKKLSPKERRANNRKKKLQQQAKSVATNSATTSLSEQSESEPSEMSGIVLWQQPMTISSGEDDVATRGTLIEAFNGVVSSLNDPGMYDATINGTLFKGKKLATGRGNPKAEFYPSAPQTPYGTLLGHASYGDELNELTVGDGKLEEGNSYLIQLWYLDQRSVENNRSMQFSSGGGESVSLNDQFVFGVFKANRSGSQIININAPPGVKSHLNAYQLRENIEENNQDNITSADPRPTKPILAASSEKTSKSEPNQPANSAPKRILVYPSNPFTDAPSQVNLPPLNQTVPARLGAVYLPDESELDLKIHYKKSLSKTGVGFRLKRFEDHNHWNLFFTPAKSTSTDGEIEVASFFHSELGLHFEWHPSAKDHDNVNCFRNAVIELSTSAEIKRLIGLRTPIVLGQFDFSKDYMPTLEKEIPWAPEERFLKIQGLPYPNAKVGQTIWDPKFADRRKPASAFFERAKQNRFVCLNVEGDLKGGKLKLGATINLLTDKNPKPFKAPSEFQVLIKQMSDSVSKSQNELQATKDRPQKAKLDAVVKEKQRLLNSHKAVAARLLSENLGVQVVHEVEGTTFVIARTGKQAPYKRLIEKVDDFNDYRLVYELDLANLGKKIKYDSDLSGLVEDFDRVAYMLVLQKGKNWNSVFVSMDAFTNDIDKIGIPTLDSKAEFQVPVKAMSVFSKSNVVASGKGFKAGFIEFWPYSYTPPKPTQFPLVRTANAAKFDYGDTNSKKGAYGSMQVHNVGKKQTVFAINNLSNAAEADIGIGNNKTAKGHPDWTFSKNASQYSQKTLRVYVRPKRKP